MPVEAPGPSKALGKFAATGTHYYPHPSGEVWGLTLLVDFPDQAPAFTPAEIDAWLNRKGFNRFGCNGSVRDYYADVSNGKVDFRNEIHGFYRAKNPKSYYEGGSGYERAGELVAEMLDHFDPEVDLSRFDNDKDGKVEAVSIVSYYRAAANSAVGYRFANPARPQECFFWSNLKNEGRRAVLKGSGLLVLHFDKDIGINDPPNPLCLTVVQADGKKELDAVNWPVPGSDPKDYFTQETGPSFGTGSNPPARWNNGAASGLNLYGIGPAADTIGFHVGSDVATFVIRAPAASGVAGRVFPSGPRFDLNGAKVSEFRAGIRSSGRRLYGKP